MRGASSDPVAVAEHRSRSRANSSTHWCWACRGSACPPEDVGGPPGYMDFLLAMRDPSHQQHADHWRWWGAPFDPHAFSINAAIQGQPHLADLSLETR